MVTEYPLASKSLPNDAETIPFPSEEVTPPVTKIYLVGEDLLILNLRIYVNVMMCCEIKRKSKMKIDFF
jgi:hypothetical protein